MATERAHERSGRIEGTERDFEERGRSAHKPSEIPAKGWKDIAVRVKDQAKEDHITLAAAGVAFFGFLALIPALIAVVSVYGLVGDPDTVQDRVEDLAGGLPDEAKDLLVRQLTQVTESAGGALTFGVIGGILVALWSASSGVSHLMEAVNIAYEEKDRRGFLRRKALALALTVGAMAFFLVAVAVMAALPTLLRGIDLPGPLAWLVSVLVWVLLGAGFAAALTVLYRVAPNREDAEWRWVTPGSVIAVVLWLVASVAFQVYAGNFGTYDDTYGSLSAIVVLLLWLWITALAILIGAEVNAEIEHQTAVDTTTGPEQPMGRRGAVMADDLGETSG
jgi:membrane protein